MNTSEDPFRESWLLSSIGNRALIALFVALPFMFLAWGWTLWDLAVARGGISDTSDLDSVIFVPGGNSEILLEGVSFWVILGAAIGF